MADLQQFKCPCCGGAITFDSKTQKMKCPYCDAEFDVDAVQMYDRETANDDTGDMDWHMDSIGTWSENEDDNIKSYICQSCGGEIVADENTAAGVCPFCDSPVVMKGSIAGQLKPDYVIPFKLDKKAARERFAAHLENKKLLPKVFRDENHLDEIKGMYVPYWLFDTKADAHMRYKGIRTSTWSDAKFIYTRNSYYAVLRDGDIAFEHVPVDGSSKMPDDLMESLEPYDFKEAVPFNSGYFAGYCADKYDVDENESSDRANERVRNSTAESFMRTVGGFVSVIPDGGSISLKDGKAKYAMYPVWILNTTWNGEKFVFAMNGQTGKFVGNLPLDKGLLGKYFGISFAIATVICYIILAIIWFI